MNYQGEVIKRLQELCSTVNNYAGTDWYCLTYGTHQMVYVPSKKSFNSIRICIPHFDRFEHYDSELINSAINETNREVKYIKVIVLGNGIISINYDHKGKNEINSIIKHILKSLCFAAEYLKNKLHKNRIVS